MRWHYLKFCFSATKRQGLSLISFKSSHSPVPYFNCSVSCFSISDFYTTFWTLNSVCSTVILVNPSYTTNYCFTTTKTRFYILLHLLTSSSLNTTLNPFFVFIHKSKHTTDRVITHKGFSFKETTHKSKIQIFTE